MQSNQHVLTLQLLAFQWFCGCALPFTLSQKWHLQKIIEPPPPYPKKKQLWMFPQYLLIIIWHTHHYYSSHEHDETVFSKPPSELWQGLVTTVAQRGFGQPAAGRPCCGGTTSCLSGGPPSSAQGPSVCILHHRLVLQNCQRKKDNLGGTNRNNFIYIL